MLRHGGPGYRAFEEEGDDAAPEEDGDGEEAEDGAYGDEDCAVGEG